MREIGDGLRRFLEAAVNHLVEHQGQQHRRQRQQPQLERRDDQGVAQHHAEVGRLEEVDEVLEAVVECPRTGPDAGEHVVALEGDDDPVQRQVVEEDGGQQRRQDHQVQHVDAAVGPRSPPAREMSGQSPLGELAHRTISKRGGATRPLLRAAPPLVGSRRRVGPYRPTLYLATRSACPSSTWLYQALSLSSPRSRMVAIISS